jgi:hypothetical protein
MTAVTDTELRAEAVRNVATALTKEQSAVIVEAARNLGLVTLAEPLTVHDVLNWAQSTGIFMDTTAPFWREHRVQLPADWYPAFAMVALMALGRPLTMTTVTDLIRRARAAEAPYDPLPDVAHVLCRLRSMGGGYAPSMAGALANLKRGGVTGTEAEIEARLRAMTELG